MKKFSQTAGFEPARGDPNRFQVYRLNHSATTALVQTELNYERSYTCSIHHALHALETNRELFLQGKAMVLYV